jgi:hypothetical protein
MSGGISASTIFAAIGATASVFGALNQKKPEQQQQAQPLLMEQPPEAATKDTTKLAAEQATAQAKKRAAGATGRGDTIKTGGMDNALGGVGAGAGADQNKTLLGY